MPTPLEGPSQMLPARDSSCAPLKRVIVGRQAIGSRQVHLVDGTCHQRHPLQRTATGRMAPLGPVPAGHDLYGAPFGEQVPRSTIT